MINTNKQTRPRTVNTAVTTNLQTFTVYTCPANCRSHVTLLYLVNSGPNATLDIKWNRNDGTHAHILGAKNLGAGEFIQWADAYIVFEPGESLDITVQTADPHVDLIATVEEYFIALQ